MRNALTTEITWAIAQLRTAVNTRKLTQKQIASATGIDQSQISRILAGQVRRASKHVIELCKFANCLEQYQEADPTRSPMLMDALRVVWDGSDAHAEAIAGVILSLKKLKEVKQ
jgi:predicted XRE-type DNA-binding protein